MSCPGLRRRGFWLEDRSMAWMRIEAAVTIVSGILASSIALIGFGLDSVITFFAAAVVVWQLRGTVSEERLHTRSRADRHRATAAPNGDRRYWDCPRLIMSDTYLNRPEQQHRRPH